MKPFDAYPADEQELRKPPRNPYNCRHGWGLDIQRRTQQTRCAYCGVSLVDDYYHWLLMCVDHVVPTGETRRLNVSSDLANGLVNHVLACSGCNGFGNRYACSATPQTEWTLEQFVELRDGIYLERKALIAERRAQEMAFFDSQPWKQRRDAEWQKAQAEPQRDIDSDNVCEFDSVDSLIEHLRNEKE